MHPSPTDPDDTGNCPPPQEEATLISEVQLILAEKRTSLAAMRTGIAVLALPLSVLSLLVATSGHYEFAAVRHLLDPLLAFCAMLALLGFYLVARSLLRIHHQDRQILALKRHDPRLAELVDLP